MKRSVFLWGLILGIFSTRALVGFLEATAIPDMSILSVDRIIALVSLVAVVLLIALRPILGGRRPSAPESQVAQAANPDAVSDPLLEARLDETRRKLAEREEQLSFVRDVLQRRTVELDHLHEEKTALAARLDEAQAAAHRWRDEHDRVAAELQADRARFAREEGRLSDEATRVRLDASRRTDELVDAMRELVRRTSEIELLRGEAAGLRAELERTREATRDDVQRRPRAGSVADG